MEYSVYPVIKADHYHAFIYMRCKCGYLFPARKLSMFRSAQDIVDDLAKCYAEGQEHLLLKHKNSFK